MTIAKLRKQLRAAADREPAIKPDADKLSRQLRNFNNGSDHDRAALRPMIEQSIVKIEASRAGR